MTPRDAIEAAIRPLRFAARNGYANLAVVRDVERTVARGLDRVAASLSGPWATRASEIRRLLQGFDRLEPGDKRVCVERALAVLEGAAPSAGPGAAERAAPSSGGPAERAAPSSGGPAARAAPSAGPGAAERAAPSSGGPADRSAPSAGAWAERGAPSAGAWAERGAPSAGAWAERAAPSAGPGAERAAPSAGPGAERRSSGSSGDPGSPSPDEVSQPLPSPKAMFLAAPRPEPVRLAHRVPLHAAEPEHLLVQVMGIGEKTAERLAAKGIETVQDALFFLPLRYEDRTRVDRIADVPAGARATVEGMVVLSALRFAGRKRLWEIGIRDSSGTLSCRFFRFKKREMEARYTGGTRVRAHGTVTFFGAQRQMAHPELEVIRPDQKTSPLGGEVKPIYPEVAGVPPRTLQRVLQTVAEASSARVRDPVPAEVRARQSLAALAPAVRAAHLPTEASARMLRILRRRLAFDELLYLQLALGRARAAREEKVGLAHELGPGWRPLAARALPFSPTKAQARVLDEISADLAAPRPMSRLLQGDVGSGKTAVALLSAALVHQGGRQAALLAPTEILAEQHAKNAQPVLGSLGVHTALLTGSTTDKARAALLRALRRGDVHVLIGTHALLEPDVEFRDLGLAIIDEQHRFGVEQRARLLGKRGDVVPDVLVMTATPIPRTLTLSLYGDLRVSVIDELPPGRTPTTTRVYGKREAETARAEVLRALDAGRQAYVVYPLVEASEQLELKAATDALEELTEALAPHRVGLLHGKMRSDEKSAVMRAFARGEIAALVATTVIEVGVDVPNATVMVVEEADRFGLSQLHQLRGRVGRGRHPGLCLLLAGESAGADAQARLGVMAETTDGFLIAERDLEIRGPGEVLGTRQSGLPDLAVANLVSDGRLLEAAREETERILLEDPDLSNPAHAGLRAEMERRFGEKLNRIRAG